MKYAGFTALLTILIYVVISMTPANQYALLCAIIAFVSLNISPALSAVFAGRMDARDAARWAREEAEAQKKADLLVSLGNGREDEFFPIGGHRRANSPIAFHIYAENAGDAAADDVTVTVGLPTSAHPSKLVSERRPIIRDTGSIEWQVVEREASEAIEFKANHLPNNLGYVTGVVEIQRPLYERQQRHLGLLVVALPQGTFEFPWLIESSKGSFRSDESSSLKITMHDEAFGHDHVEPRKDPNNECSLCRTLREMPQWSRAVDQQLEPYRALEPEKNPNRKPWMTSGGNQVQWYQEWTGPHRGVTCEAESGKDLVVRAYFWKEGEWELRQTRSISMGNVAEFAADIWAHLKPY